MLYVEINNNTIGTGVRLAGKNEARFHFLGFEGIVDVHVYLTFQQLGAAGATYPPLAGVWKVSAIAQGGIEQCLGAGMQVKRNGFAIQLDLYRGEHVGYICRGSASARFRQCSPRAKQLQVYALAVDALGQEGILYLVNHLLGAAKEKLIGLLRIKQQLAEGSALAGVNATAEEVAV